MRRRTNSRPAADPWSTALRLLARRDYGTAELRRRLLDKGCAPAAVDGAIARALELGYLDDARYVERLSRALLEAGRASGPRLELELRRRGLPEELITAALAAGRESGAEAEALRALAARRFATFDYASAAPAERRRVVTFLQRRGFTLDCILNELKRNDR